MLDFEIDVSLQVVRQEAYATFEREKLPGEREMVHLRLVEETAGGAEVAADERLEAIDAEILFSKVHVILAGRRRGGADHVAEIVERRAGHGGVEVDDADGFRGDFVEKHVVELGVIVGDALRDVPRGDEAGDARAIRGAGEREIYLGLDLRGSVPGVELDGGAQRIQTFGRMVEIGDRLVQPRAAEIGSQLLETPEGLGRLEGLFVGLDLIVAARAFDEWIDTPIISQGIDGEWPPIDGLDAGQGPAVCFRMIPGEQASERVTGDPLDVLHQRGRGFEDIGIDALEDVAQPRAGLVEAGAIGVIDVSGAVRNSALEVGAQVEESGNLAEIGDNNFFVHICRALRCGQNVCQAGLLS